MTLSDKFWFWCLAVSQNPPIPLLSGMALCCRRTCLIFLLRVPLLTLVRPWHQGATRGGCSLNPGRRETSLEKVCLKLRILVSSVRFSLLRSQFNSVLPLARGRSWAGGSLRLWLLCRPWLAHRLWQQFWRGLHIGFELKGHFDDEVALTAKLQKAAGLFEARRHAWWCRLCLLACVRQVKLAGSLFHCE